MIKFENRFDEYAYRVAQFPLDDSITSIEEGTWVTITGGKVVPATVATKKAFIAIGSKRAGRDQISGKITKKISFLSGHFILSVDKFDAAKTYGDLTPLKIDANSVLTPTVTDDGALVVAYSVGAPVGGYLRIISA